MPRQHDHCRPQAKGPRTHRKAGEKHEGGRDLVPAAEVVLDQKGRMEPERLGLHVEIEIVVEALAGFSREILAVSLGRAEETESHGHRRPRSLGASAPDATAVGSPASS